jgi:hypothetical protein
LLRNQGDAFQLYVQEGRLSIDNQDVKRGYGGWPSIARTGCSLEARTGDRMATTLDVIRSAHRHDLDLWADLRDVLVLWACRPGDLPVLLSVVWKVVPPKYGRTFRAQKKEQGAATRRYGPAQRWQAKRTPSPPIDSSQRWGEADPT